VHAAMISGRLGVGALIAWLRQRIDEEQSTSMDARSRRLETDDQAVQVLTVHRSKGLQFPIVYLPDTWDRWCPDDSGQVLRVHDQLSAAAARGELISEDRSADPQVTPPPTADDLVLDVGGQAGSGRKDRVVQDRLETAGDDLRLAYVAMTRAQLQVVTWWMHSWNTPGSALQRFLFRSREQLPDGTPAELKDRYPVTADPGQLGLGPGFSIESIQPRQIPPGPERPVPVGALRRRLFDRVLDLEWRRTSYTSLTAAAHGTEVSAAGVTSEAEPAKEDDETQAAETLAEATAVVTAALDGPVSPMDELPSGAAFGSIVHAIFERVDPQDGDLAASLERIATEELAHLPAQPMTAQALATGIRPAWLTPRSPIGSRNSASSCRWPAASHPGQKYGWATSPTCSPGCCPPTIHLPAIRRCCPSRCWPNSRCGAT
jgi:exodeoxyribonuclease V beta subunit